MNKFKKDFEYYAEGMRLLEQQIFQNCKLKPEDVSDESCKELIKELKNYEL